MKTTIRIAAALLALTTIGAAAAQSAPIDAEVKKVDEGAGKITLKHGAAKSLGMNEPMTMVYRAKDPAMLGKVKVGNQIRFEAESSDQGFIVTKIEKR